MSPFKTSLKIGRHATAFIVTSLLFCMPRSTDSFALPRDNHHHHSRHMRQADRPRGQPVELAETTKPVELAETTRLSTSTKDVFYRALIDSRDEWDLLQMMGHPMSNFKEKLYHRLSLGGDHIPRFAQALTDDSNCTGWNSINHTTFPQIAKLPLKFDIPRKDVVPRSVASVSILNAGQGTSGTRMLHNALCAAGISSLHYNRSCWVTDEALALQANVLSLHATLKDCAYGTLARRDPKCAVRSFRKQMLGNISAIVQSGVTALSDVPYSDMIPVLRALVPGKLHFLMTIRDPENWAKRRYWHNAEDVICKDPASVGAASYFDMFGCMNGGGEQWLADVFEPIGRSIKLWTLIGAKYSHHNAVIQNTVRSDNLREMCAWDTNPDYNEQVVLSIVSLLNSTYREPVTRLKLPHHRSQSSK